MIDFFIKPRRGSIKLLIINIAYPIAQRVKHDIIFFFVCFIYTTNPKNNTRNVQDILI
jgi:hypothetical protein